MAAAWAAAFLFSRLIIRPPPLETPTEKFPSRISCQSSRLRQRLRRGKEALVLRDDFSERRYESFHFRFLANRQTHVIWQCRE
jgi:hypothetical protein